VNKGVFGFPHRAQGGRVFVGASTLLVNNSSQSMNSGGTHLSWAGVDWDELGLWDELRRQLQAGALNAVFVPISGRYDVSAQVQESSAGGESTNPAQLHILRYDADSNLTGPYGDGTFGVSPVWTVAVQGQKRQTTGRGYSVRGTIEMDAGDFFTVFYNGSENATAAFARFFVQLVMRRGTHRASRA
jgi:hypothetical protein